MVDVSDTSYSSVQRYGFGDSFLFLVAKCILQKHEIALAEKYPFIALQSCSTRHGRMVVDWQ